ncbi:MAG: S9 family peptidase [Bacteroidales bacterium]|nr:S9 family peptidase [Bacteroidales bacterium]MDD3701449.1 S9 family peptidase [Bacteroidales bacterium]MDY0369969.1 S9 family peptidase [Bacteroidales bacterium]
MKSIRTFFVTLLSLLLMIGQMLMAQTRQISLEQIWNSRIFSPELVYGINPLLDGKSYAVIEAGNIEVYDLATGEKLTTMVHSTDLLAEGSDTPISLRSYTLSADETKILIPTETEPIYRHSTRSSYYWYDSKTNKLAALSEHGKQQLANFSPDGTKIAFVRDNNLFVKYLTSGEEKQLTTDGMYNKIINGTTDWVYEEEFGFTKAFFWAPNSKKIGFYRFDESQVKEFQMTMYNGLYPEQYRFKYPKAGEDNAVVSILIWDEETDSLRTMDTGEETDIYIPRISWTQNSDQLAIQRLNRHQNHLEILIAKVTDGTTHILYEEENPYYIDITDDLYFLPDGKHFYISSEKEGYNQIYLYDMKGNLVKKLTETKWDITKIYGYDAKHKRIYFQAADRNPLDRSILYVDLKGKITPVIQLEGTNNAVFSQNFDLLINYNSTINSPYDISVYNSKGKKLRQLIDNAKLRSVMEEYNFGSFSFFTMEDEHILLPDNQPVSLNGWKLLPPDFDPEKKYPVLIYVYGGPGSQTVVNSWGGSNHIWFQMLAQQGFIVVSVDNRGTGARGQVFKKMTYLELGKYETQDMITTAKFLARQPYVDSSAIGIFGWSYGGYMSSLAITKGNEVFQSAIAVAPVTNWRYYDNIYTERFMRRPQENASGYDENSPINHVDKLKGQYLLVHGSADDNVHYQNAMEMANALIKENKAFEMMFYPNRNHGIYSDNARLHLYELMTGFLHRSLKAE